MATIYILAGLNHFRVPRFYIPMIPPYLPSPKSINFLAGIFEILFGMGLFFHETRSLAAIGIILILVAFVPAHIYMITTKGRLPGGIKMPLWFAWVRLFPAQLILIWWASIYI